MPAIQGIRPADGGRPSAAAPTRTERASDPDPIRPAQTADRGNVVAVTPHGDTLEINGRGLRFSGQNPGATVRPALPSINALRILTPGRGVGDSRVAEHVDVRA